MQGPMAREVQVLERSGGAGLRQEQSLGDCLEVAPPWQVAVSASTLNLIRKESEDSWISLH